MVRVNRSTFLILGGFIVGQDLRRPSREKLKLFRSFFGVSPATCVDLWRRCSLPAKGQPKHLLWALMYLKVYGTEFALSACARTTRKTFRKWVKLFVRSISDLAPNVIKWSNRFRKDRGKQCKVTVDGTDFRIYQQYPFNKKWYSYKHRGPGLRYEVAVCIQSGDIVWINGPFPCGRWPDIKIFRRNLVHLLAPGERAEADDGYVGRPDKVRTPGMVVSKSDKRAKKKARARHETVNKRFKQWGCLQQRYRHSLNDHHLIFSAVAVCTQLSLENGEPLFDVNY